MTLPSLASLEQLDARLPGGVDDDDEARAQAALDDASVLVRAAAGKTWVTTDDPPVLSPDVPDVAVFVTLAAARRAFENPTGITQKTAGDVSISYAARKNADVYLTADERAMIKSAAGRSGLYTISTTRADPGLDTVYVPVVGTDTQFPWYAAGDPQVFP